MSELRTCPQGHQWELSGDAPGLQGPVPDCPVCRLLGGSLPPPEEPPLPASDQDGATLPSAEERPPPDSGTNHDENDPGEGPSSPAAAGSQEPAVTGYEILEILGQGAMAAVYRARQTSLGRLVALKILLAGSHASPRARARFRAEAEVVARLQHPNIVQIYEVGEQDGLPYLSLELVEGGSLDEHLARGTQPARQAARTVATLARAAHYAHQHHLVHRDLKPANILLTPEGTPKITDFGLAKDLSEESGQTRTGTVVGTPSYMAPEQAAGRVREIGPATDVYALGAILYEMLTGRAPFRADTILNTLEQVRSQEPLPPTRLQPKVPRDLETICLKCLHKEPARRYSSGEALAQDLDRFLAGQPIQARRTSLWERGLKWARRRPAAAALVVVTGLGTLCLLAVILWSYYQIARQRDRANASFRKAMDAMGWLTEAEERLPQEPDLEVERRSRLDRALAFYQDFLRDRGDDPAVRREIAAALQGVGDIARLLGQKEQAQEAYTQALALLNQLAAEAPAEAVYRERLAYCNTFLGEALRAAGQVEPARQAYRSALEIQRQLAADFPRQAAYRKDLARCHYNLGIVLGDTNHPREAEHAFREAIGLLQALVKQTPEEPHYRQGLARCQLDLGPVLRRAGRFPEAQAAYQKAIALLNDLAKQFPKKPEYRHELAVSFANLGNLQVSTGNYPAAQAAYGEGRALLQDLIAAYPRRPVYRKELANTWNSLGTVFALRQNAHEAATAWGQAAAIFGKLRDEFPQVADYEGGLGMALGNLGWLNLRDQQGLVLASLGGSPLAVPGLLTLRRLNLTETSSGLEQAATHLVAALKPNPNHPAYRQALRGVYLNWTEALLLSGDHHAAAATAAALLRVFPERGADYFFAARVLARCLNLAAGDGGTSGPDGELTARRYAAQAVQFLRTAARKGYRPVKELSEDAAFRLLRQRPECSAMLGEREGKVRAPVP